MWLMSTGNEAQGRVVPEWFWRASQAKHRPLSCRLLAWARRRAKSPHPYSLPIGVSHAREQGTGSTQDVRVRKLRVKFNFCCSQHRVVGWVIVKG